MDQKKARKEINHTLLVLIPTTGGIKEPNEVASEVICSPFCFNLFADEVR